MGLYLGAIMQELKNDCSVHRAKRHRASLSSK